MLRAITVSLLLLAGLLLIATSGTKTSIAAAIAAPMEETLVDGDKMMVEIAAELADDDNGESAAWAEGPLPLVPGVAPPPTAPRRIVWVRSDHRLHPLEARPLLPPPRPAA